MLWSAKNRKADFPNEGGLPIGAEAQRRKGPLNKGFELDYVGSVLATPPDRHRILCAFAPLRLCVSAFVTHRRYNRAHGMEGLVWCG